MQVENCMEMLESEKEKCQVGAVKESVKDTFSVSSEIIADQLTYKLVRVDEDGSFISTLEDELMEVDHFLAEPKLEKIVEDGIIGLESNNLEKCLKNEDFRYPDDYCQIKANYGTLDSNANQGAEESKFEFLDGMLQGMDEEGSLHVPNDLSSDCADYLLDPGFAEKNSHLDYIHCGHNLEKSCSESLSPGLNEKELVSDGLPNLSTAVVPYSESTIDQSTFLLDNMSIRELHEAFRSTFGRETSVKDKHWLKRRILFGLQNLIELENGSSLLLSGLSSHENEVDLIFSSGNDSSGSKQMTLTSVHGTIAPLLGRDVEMERDTENDAVETGFANNGSILGDREGALVSRKRIRKPTRRYIEESDMTSRTCGKLEYSTASMMDKFSQARSHNQHHQKRCETTPLLSRQDSAGGSALVPFAYRVRRGRPRKNTSLKGHDSKDYKDHRVRSAQPKRSCGFASPYSESQDDLSDDCAPTVRTQKVGRRKHHRLWTLSEVMKLIEGVSRYGVGRWTDIKRLLFPSSAHRTSVDLKDKWRNLLRASCVPMKNKKEVEQRKKHASLPIPQTVLRRVRELAVIYPYPRERKSKLPHPADTPEITSPSNDTSISLASPSNDTSISRSGRILHRRNFT